MVYRKLTGQTISISSLDPRVTQCDPVAGMEMLDVDNWDNDVGLSRFADSPFRALAQSRAMEGGEKVLHCLALKKAFAEGKEYDLILSDVDLDRQNRGEVIAIMEGYPKLKLIQVIVLTSSGCRDEIGVCDRL